MKFIVDMNVGRLARWLRVLGYDTLFINPIDDGELVDIARREGRVLLTKDGGIMRRRVVESGEVRALLLEGDDWQRWLAEVVERFGLRRDPVFDRCPECNTPLVPRTRNEARAYVPPYVYRTQESFVACPGCGRHYWRGTHWQRMGRDLPSILRSVQSSGTEVAPPLDRPRPANGGHPMNPIQLQKYLKGVDYPASKDDLVRAAETNGADDDVRSALQSLPDSRFDTPADVSQSLPHTH